MTSTLKSTSQLKKEIEIDNHNQKQSNIEVMNFNLQKKLEERNAYRIKNWSDDEIRNYYKFLLKLNVAHKKIIENLTQLIVTKAENVLKKNINTTSFKIWFDIQDNINNSQFKINTILYGFKNPKNNTLCRLRHLEAGITQTPITILNSDLNKYGYIIKDISDTSKSFQKIWEVTIM